MAGATSPQSQSEAAMVKAIREAGKVPVQRNTFYEPVKVWDQTAATSAEAASAAAPTGSATRTLEANLATA